MSYSSVLALPRRLQHEPARARPESSGDEALSQKKSSEALSQKSGRRKCFAAVTKFRGSWSEDAEEKKKMWNMATWAPATDWVPPRTWSWKRN